MVATCFPEIFDVQTPEQAREYAWMSDGIDTRATLVTQFAMMREGKPPEDIAPRDLGDIIFWGFYAKKPARTPG